MSFPLGTRPDIVSSAPSSVTALERRLFVELIQSVERAEILLGLLREGATIQREPLDGSRAVRMKVSLCEARHLIDDLAPTFGLSK